MCGIAQGERFSTHRLAAMTSIPSSKKRSQAKPATKKLLKPEEIELDPDAWPKFEQLIRDAAKLGPKRHEAKKK